MPYKALSPWDCPFCGRLSFEEPALGPFKPQRHAILDTGMLKIMAVRCWHCGARGPLSDSPKQAIERWRHLASRKGAPTW